MVYSTKQETFETKRLIKAMVRDIDNGEKYCSSISHIYPHILRAVFIRIRSKIKEIEAKISITRNIAIDHSKIEVQPNEIDINFLKFYETFKDDETKWDNLYYSLNLMMKSSKSLSSLLSEKKYADQMNELIDPKIHSIAQINAEIDILATRLEKYKKNESDAKKTSKEQEILNLAKNLLIILNEITNKQRKIAAEEKSSKNGLTSFENEVSVDLITQRKRLKQLRIRIPGLEVEKIDTETSSK